MIEKNMTVLSAKGLHARPSAILVQKIAPYESSVKIVTEDMEIDAKSIMGILTLAAGPGTVLNFVIEGPDEKEAAQALEDFFNSDYENPEVENEK
jgi:phosphocarrier protein